MYSGHSNYHTPGLSRFPNETQNEPIFEDHSCYMRQTVRQASENNHISRHVYAQVDSRFQRHNYNGLQRGISEHKPFSNTETRRLLPNSISYDSYMAGHLDKQGKDCDKLQYAIKASKEALADVEHTMLEREQELYQLNCIEKNPSQNDLQKLQAEVKELQRSVQKLCLQMDTNNAPSTSSYNMASPNARLYNNYLEYTRPGQANYQSYDRLPLESPTTRLLRNPIDNSLVFSREDY